MLNQGRSKKGIDWPTIIMALMLIAFGVMNIYSVDPEKGIRQLIFAGMSLILIFGLISVSNFTSNFFEVYSPLLYIFSLLLLVAVLIFGREINGAKAWFDFGVVSFQPVEVAKLATGLMLARYISSPAIEINSRKTAIGAFTIIAIPIVLIMMQPDLGSVIVFSSFIVALYREGFSIWYIFIPVIGGSVFLLSISYPPVYVLILIAIIVEIVCLLIIAFTYDRKYLRMILGIQLALVFFFLVMIAFQYIFPGFGNLEDTTAKHFEDLKTLKFNVIFYSLVGFLTAALSAVSISYFLLLDNSESPFKIFSTKFGPNQSYEVALVSIVISVLLSVLSFSADKVYMKLPTHQQERIMVLFEGEGKYRDTSGYNLLYSKTAIGSGDLWGKGYLQGTVKIGRFVPEQSTDYIFCTVGEEWGFVGSTILVIFYCVFILRIYYLAESQRDNFDRFFGYATATIFLLHFFINIAMVMGLFPTVGIPLPFFSYGGSSLWAFITLLTVFLILNYKDKQTLI